MNDETQQQINVYLQARTHKRFKLHAVNLGLSMSELVRNLIEDYLRRHEDYDSAAS